MKASEKFIQWLWENKKIAANLRTISNKSLKIIFPGIPNFEDGPDFKNAIIKFDKKIQGDIEIHLSSKDWFSHKHNTDPKYDNVILHIIMECRGGSRTALTAITSKGREIETLVLSRWLQKPLQELYEEFTVNSVKIEVCPSVGATRWVAINEVLFAQGIVRFNTRKQKFGRLIELYGREQAIYIGIMEALGYVKNESAFVKLANYVPIQILKRLTNGKNKDERIEIIKAVLLGVAGFISDELKSLWEEICEKEKFPVMQKEEWQFFKVRPRGFPQYRIRNISYFLADSVKYGICDLLLKQELDIKKLSICISQEKFGESYINTVILNVYSPVLAILSPEEAQVMELYKNYKALPQNNITNFMSKLLLDGKKCQKEIYNQGMIHIFHKYCKGKNCNACPVKKTL